ncbi:MAG: putative sulfate exporter family transporter, partial [Anaerovoracaceae bacterium]
FLLAAVINTVFFLPASLPAGMAEISGSLTQLGKFFIIVAMAGIGLNTDIIKLIKNGLRPALLGLFCWAVVGLVSFLLL